MNAAATTESSTLLNDFRADLAELWAPETALERHEVENIAQALLRQRLLDRLEEKVLTCQVFDLEPAQEANAKGKDAPNAPASPKPPSLDSLVRYRRRLAKELTDAGKRLAGLKRARLRAGQAEATAAGKETPTTAEIAALEAELFGAPAHKFGTVEHICSEDCAVEASSALNRAQRRRLAAERRKAS